MRPIVVALALATLAAGCTSPADENAPSPSATIDGAIVIGDAFVLEDARLSVAAENAGPEGTPGRAIELADPPWTARTWMQRDHWVLEATIRERAPGTGLGEHRVRLDWNGALAGAVHVEGGAQSSSALAVIVRFDLGADLPPTNIYTFEITRTP